MRTSRVGRGRVVAVCSAIAATLACPAAGAAQRATLYQQAALPMTSTGAFRERFAAADRQLGAIELARAQLFDALREADVRAEVRDAQFGRYLSGDLFVNPPRFPTSRGTPGEPFRQLVPEAQAMLDWTHAFRRQVYDVLAQPGARDEDRLGRITELVGYYRSRPAVSITTRPKDVGALNAQPGATAFRVSHPRVNGQLWSAHWFELALLETLTVGRTAPDQADLAGRAAARFREMLTGAPASAPFLMPMSTAVAPVFAARFADVAAILDNLHLLQDYIADLMVAREIPRSAHRREIMRALEFFRSDTTAPATFAAWSNTATTLGVHNMGGTGVGFAAAPQSPSVPRGMSLASTMNAGAMAGMDHGAMAGAQDSSSLRAVVDRMLADPVIRERAATDPVLQRMLQASGGANASMAGMGNMAGMQHGNMPMGQTPNAVSGMSMNSAAAAGLSPEEQRLRNDFILRLLADPGIEARIHADPQLHRLWSDPEVQRRLQELRGARTAPTPNVTPRTAPAPAAPPPHRHP